MKLKVCSLACLLLMVYSQLSPVYAQKASTEKDQQEQKVTLGTSEVLLDVVVRDKKGRPVKDLSANDFEIYEDGVKQKVESFQLYQRDAGEKTASPVAPSTNARVTPTAAPAQVHDPFAGVSVVALVFDRLSPEARELAHKAALKYVSSTLTQQDLTGVFAIDLSLHVLQPFTNNNELLRKAIDQASSASTSAFPSSQEEIAQLSDSLDSLEQQVSSTSSGSGGGATPNDPSSGAALAAARMSLNMAESFEILERDEQGYATTNGLIAIINSLKGIEGRKAIVFFSEGLAIPPAVVAHFKSVISDANRANVSVYSIDAAGLRVTSPLADSIRQTNSMGSRRMRSVQANEDTSGHPMSRDLERNEDFLRLNPDSGLASLADQTGGFLIADTNNLTNGLVRIDEDFRFHYVLSYVPQNLEYDGKFRQIAVKVSKPGFEVQARKGYYAVPANVGSPVLAFEVPALAALSSGHPQNQLPVRVSGLSFPEPKRPGLVPVLVRIPGSALSYTIDSEKKTYKGDFTVLALIKDSSGNVVRKVSQHYQLNGPADNLKAARSGEILFYREAVLDPGAYSVEAIGFDTATGRTGIGKAAVVVPPADDNKLRLSSVCVLNRVERLNDEDKKVNNPFHYGELLIYPNMGEVLHKAARKEIAFFFTAYTPKGSSTSPKLKVDVTTPDGKQLAEVSPVLPAPDQDGRIQFASEFPLESFPSGQYSLKITVADEQGSVSRSTQFTVQP